MKKTKSRLFLILFLTLLPTFSFAMRSTNKTKSDGPRDHMRIAALKGPTAIGILPMIEDRNNASAKYDFNLAVSANEITPLLLQDKLDIIAAPVNLGSVLYNKTNKNISMLAINTLAVQYIVQKTNSNSMSIKTIADLKGKTIYSTGKGAVPEAIISHLLFKAGLDINKDVNMVWKNEPTEITAMLIKENEGIAMLPQPFVTVALKKIPSLKIVLELGEEWKKTENGNEIVTGAVFCKKDFADKHPELIKAFLKDYEKSCKRAVSDIDSTADFCDKYDIIKSDIAKKAILLCNIKFISGNEMKNKTQTYLEVLFNHNPSFIGGAIPKDDFYFIR